MSPPRRIEEWKQKLIDLSRSNRLLAYRHPRASAVRVVEEDPAEVEGLLSAGRKLGVDAKPEAPAASGTVRTGDARLQTDLEAPELAKVLQRLYRESRASIEEQGFNTLHVAIGTLVFTTPDDPRPWRAPLLLLPVRLERRGVRSDYSLSATEDETEVNPALRVKLEKEFGVRVALPEDPEGWTWPVVADAFRAAVAGRAGWTVEGEVHLALFSFAKIPLYRDLVDEGERFAAHPIVSTLATGTLHPDLPPAQLPTPEEVEADPTSGQILDADGSQRAALLAARRGVSFVLQGPPGTGKSQTIANAIAEAVAQGKSVLFVSEKMAALEVVKQRLDRAGLGHFVLELHSRWANRREVVQSLGRTWRLAAQPARPGRDAWPEIAEIQTRLRGLLEALHAPRGAAGFSAWKVLGEAARLRAVVEVPFAVPAPLEVDGPALVRRRALLQEVATVREAVEPLARNPWRAVRRTQTGVGTMDEVRRALTRLAGSVDLARDAGRALAACLGSPAPATPGATAAAHALAEAVLAAPPVPGAWMDADHAALSPRVASALAVGRDLQAARETLLARYDESLLATDPAPLLHRARPGGGLFGWFRRRGVRKALRAWLPPGAALPDDPLADLREAAKAREAAGTVAAAEPLLLQAFGNAYEGPKGDFRGLSSRVEAARRVVAAWPAGLPVSPETRRLVEGTAREPLRAALEPSRKALEELRARWAEAVALLVLDEATQLPGGLAAVPVDALESAVDAWLAGISDLPAWISWQARRHEAVGQGLGEFLDSCDAREVPSAQLVNAWFRGFFRAFADRLLADVEALRDFDGRTHESRLERYATLDRGSLASCGERLAARLRSALPPLSGGSVAESETAVLRREIEKQTRHMSVRRLFERVPNLIRTLKPCLMMSPLSVATYLPPDVRPFDLVVFDEASQICTEDAVGALARGRQAIVAGDSRQLPPTRFFERRLEDGEDLPEEAITDLPSVLDECQASRLAQVRLLWHYRSRDESLIAFSNAHFYDDALVTFPNPARDAEDLGISFVHVADGVYDPGRSRTNAREAQVVAERVFEILRTRPRDSVGVVTFGTPQRDAVLDALEAIRREDPSQDARFEGDVEPVFVKNLEAVQGDERDVILFSVGFGRDAAGTFRHTFGPLNEDGGDRRLNVAVTRARKQVVVHASIQPEDIDLERAPSRGARLLKAYLEVARAGMALEAAVGDAADLPPLVEAVREELAARGHRADPLVGRSSFKIDLAVRHPDRPGRHLLAVVCDGPVPSASVTTRDRERLRAQVLENLGWRVHRVWAADWSRHPDREAERLLAAIEAARRAPPPVPPRPAPPPPVADDEGPASDSPAGEAAGEPHVPGTAPYAAARLPPLGLPEDLPEAPVSRVAHALRRVLEAEAPVHEAIAARRIAQAWGMRRAGSRVLERVREAAEALVRKGEASRRGPFLHVEPARPAVARTPADGVERAIHEIDAEEVAEALRKVVAACVGAPRDALVRQAARVLGFTRPTGRVASVVEGVLASLLGDGTFVEEGGLVRRAVRAA